MDTGRFPAASFEARRARPRTDLTNDEYAEYLGVGLSLSDLRELAMRDTSGYEECIYEISPLDPDIVIQRFPDEIFHKVFENLSGRDLYNVQLTCKHLSGLAHDPLLYKALCENEFRYWDDHNNLDAKINAAASETDWQSLYTRRKADESTILQRLGQLVHEPQLRARVLEGISASQYNYDYKDVFLECCKPGYTDPNDTEVVDLARQYWARQALDIIHRTKALEKWYHFKWSEPGMKPEIILGAFDMFIIHDRGMDIKEVSSHVSLPSQCEILTSFRYQRSTMT